MRGAAQEHNSAAWLREGRTDGAALAIEKAPQFTASLARFAEGVGAALEDICGPGAGAALERVAGTTTFELFGASQGYLAATMRSETLELAGRDDIRSVGRRDPAQRNLRRGPGR